MASTVRAQQRDLRALTSLLDELEELSMSPTSDSGAQARKKYLSDRIEDLVQNGCPLGALEAASPAPSYSGGPVISLDEEPLQSAVQALDQYQNLCSLIEREMKHKPRVVGFAERMTASACRWMNFIHPMNGNVTRDETTRDYQRTTFHIVSATGGMISLPRNDQTLIRFLDTAGFVTMNIDIWANFFRYNKFSPAPLAASVVSNLLCLYDVPMGGDLARAEARKRLSREMVHAFGKHPRRLCKVIARYAEVLIGSPPPEVDAQCMLFTAANTLLGVKELRPYTCPRRVVSKLVHVIDRRSRGSAHECRAAVTALRYLERLWLITSDNRTLEWSINDGILYPILRIMIAYPPPHEYHEILRPVLQTLYRSFIHYRVLLSFNRMHETDLTFIAAARRVMAIAVLKEVYDARAPLMIVARKDWALKKNLCHCAECPRRTQPHLKLRTCDCKRVYYCSKMCQRKHWIAEHHRDCDVHDGEHRELSAPSFGFGSLDMITKTGPRDMHLMRVLACDYVRARRREIIAKVNREVRRLEDRRKDIQSSRKQLMRQLATTMEFDQQVSISFLGTQLAHEISSTFSESYGTTGQCVFITSLWMEGEEEKHDCKGTSRQWPSGDGSGDEANV